MVNGRESGGLGVVIAVEETAWKLRLLALVIGISVVSAAGRMEFGSWRSPSRSSFAWGGTWWGPFEWVEAMGRGGVGRGRCDIRR